MKPLRCKRINGKMLCSLPDVARAAGVHRNAVYDAAKRGKVHVVRLFDSSLLPKADAGRYIAAHARMIARVKRGR